MRQRQLDAEGRRFCMDAMAAADGYSVLVLESALFQSGKKGIKISQQQV